MSFAALVFLSDIRPTFFLNCLTLTHLISGRRFKSCATLPAACL